MYPFLYQVKKQICLNEILMIQPMLEKNIVKDYFKNMKKMQLKKSIKIKWIFSFISIIANLNNPKIFNIGLSPKKAK